MWYNGDSAHSGVFSSMVTETVTLEDIKKRPLDEVFQEVADGLGHRVVQMPDGAEVIIESRPRLEPLPELEGYIPDGWKDAVYARN